MTGNSHLFEVLSRESVTLKLRNEIWQVVAEHQGQASAMDEKKLPQNFGTCFLGV